MFGALLESLSWCQPLLESLSWCQSLLVSLSWCQLGVRLPPRVVIVVPTVGLADWVGLPNPNSCHYRGTNRGANPSSCRYRGSNRGRDSRWQPGGCVNIHTVRIQVSVVVQTRGESNVSQPLLESLSWCQPLLVSLSLAQPGGKLSVATPCCNHSCRNSRTAPDSTRCSYVVSVLCSAPSSSRYRGANPSSSHCRGANRGTTTGFNPVL